MEIKVCEKNKTMMGGKYCGGEWKINEERMENVEIFMYLRLRFDKRMSHLEKMKEKAEKWVVRIGFLSRVNGEMEVDRLSY